MQFQVSKMSIQRVSYFYMPNMSSSIKIMKKNFNDQTQKADFEMKEESKHDIQFEFIITDSLLSTLPFRILLFLQKYPKTPKPQNPEPQCNN